MPQTYRGNRVHTYREPDHLDEIIEDDRNPIIVADSSPAITKSQMIVQYVVGIVLSLLAVRFIFALFGASESNAFVNFIYGITSPLVAPFRGLFNVTSASSGVARFEFETLVAGLIYLLIGIGIVKLLDIFRK